MLGMVLSDGQIVSPGGVMLGVPAVTLVSMLATFPFSWEAEVRFGHWPPAPKLKLFCRRRSWKIPSPPRRAILPFPNRSYAKPARGAKRFLLGEKPLSTPLHGSHTSPNGESAAIGSPTSFPVLRSIVGLLLASYLARSTL